MEKTMQLAKEIQPTQKKELNPPIGYKSRYLKLAEQILLKIQSKQPKVTIVIPKFTTVNPYQLSNQDLESAYKKISGEVIARDDNSVQPHLPDGMFPSRKCSTSDQLKEIIKKIGKYQQHPLVLNALKHTLQKQGTGFVNENDPLAEIKKYVNHYLEQLGTNHELPSEKILENALKEYLSRQPVMIQKYIPKKKGVIYAYFENTQNGPLINIREGIKLDIPTLKALENIPQYRIYLRLIELKQKLEESGMPSIRKMEVILDPNEDKAYLLQIDPQLPPFPTYLPTTDLNSISNKNPIVLVEDFAIKNFAVYESKKIIPFTEIMKILQYPLNNPLEHI
ncbi:MAG: hypothetical protein GXN99_03085, partial [Candidatus Nanohaloarchaeota archaeon]|nr:hypothetical protein [Candidatus Nanohaloarchaeota archaeon]